MINVGNTYKYLKLCSQNGRYFDLVEVLTYGRAWNFIIGSRNIGKSTGVACFFLIDYLLNGHKFIYTRRDEDEIQKTCHTFFGSAVPIINACCDFKKIKDVTYYAGKYTINYTDGKEEECGATVPLSLEQKYKSANFEEYFNLVYDEFIATDETRYLGSKKTPDREYNATLSLFQTMDRGINNPFRNEVRFFFLGNTWTVYNPIFLSLGISEYMETNTKWIRPKGEEWLVQSIDGVEATKEFKESNAYKLSNRLNRAYAYENKGTDNADYIERMPKGAERNYCITLIFEGKKYGVYECQSKYYIGRYMNLGKPEVALDTRSHYENDLMLITSWLDLSFIRVLLDSFKHNRLYFENGSIKNVFYRYFKLMP